MLTPEKLREVADYLDHDTDRCPSEREFTCIAVSELFDSDTRDEYERLIENHGLIANSGTLRRYGEIVFTDRPNGMTFDSDYYRKNAMPVRFMFLEFLALDMESRS